MYEYKLSEKENHLRLLSGEVPEYLQRFDYFGWMVRFSLFDNRISNGSGFDAFGVEYIGTEDTNGAALPAPGRFILEDITKWRDVIKTPDLSNVDWEAVAKNDLAGKDVISNPLYMSTHMGYFQMLMSFMGFTEGLCAMHEEPEEVKALFDYLAEYYCEIERKSIKHYQPDVFHLVDDTATAANPFISPKMYRELIKPYHKKQTDIALENGLKINTHNCGRCEDFIDDWIELGITGWNPAQVVNDLRGIKKKYGSKLVLAGCWDSTGPVSWLTTDDRSLKDALVEYVDTFAPGGGFCFSASVMGTRGNEAAKRKMGIINDFYHSYARDWYRTNG